MRRALGDFGAEGGVAALSAAARHVPAPLGRLVLREEGGGQLPPACDEGGIEAVVFHQREAELLEAGAQFFGEIARWGGQREDGEGIEVHGLRGVRERL